MASLVLPNMTLRISVWYIDPPASTPPSQLRPYHALTPVQLVPTTPSVVLVPSQPQQVPAPIVKVSKQGGKSKRKEHKDKAPQASSTPEAPNPSPPHTLCKVVGHATNNCLELPHLKPLVHETFPESNIPEFNVTLPSPSKKLKALQTNHPCALCDHHGHYSHCCPHLDEFCDSLEAICEYETTRSGSPTPLPMDSGTTSKPKQGDSGPTITITPPDVEMTDPMGHILYLSSSLSSLQENLSKVSAHTSIKPLSIESQVSTSIDPPSTSSLSTIPDDASLRLMHQVPLPHHVVSIPPIHPSSILMMTSWKLCLPLITLALRQGGIFLFGGFMDVETWDSIERGLIEVCAETLERFSCKELKDDDK